MVGTAADITERKLAEIAIAQHAAEVNRSNEDLEQFAQVASHDLRSPFNNISNFTELFEHQFTRPIAGGLTCAKDGEGYLRHSSRG